MTLAEYLPVVQRTPEWVEAREHGVGASECAAALGISRWESRFGLWARKCKLAPPVEPSLAMEIGTITEPLNAAKFEAETGFRTRKVNRLLRSKAFPFMLASLDRAIVGEDAVLEMKWTERGDGYGDPGTDQVPEEVLAQVVQQMAVTGRGRAYVSVLFGGRRHGIYVVDRDPEAEAAVIDELAGFWQHVVERTQPPVDGSESTARALAAAFPRDNGEAITADERLTRFLAELRDTRDQLRDLEAGERELEAAIKSAMGEASELVAPGIGRVTWKAAKDSEVTDWKAIAASYRNLLARHLDTDSLDALQAEHTTTRPGSRRFLARWEEEPA